MNLKNSYKIQAINKSDKRDKMGFGDGFGDSDDDNDFGDGAAMI